MQKTKLQKIMTQPIHLIFNHLTAKNRIQIWLYENKDLKIEGVIVGFDEYMNLVLDDASEVHKNGNIRQVGRIMLRGDNITLIKKTVEAPTKKLQNFSEEFNTTSHSITDYISDIPGFELNEEHKKIFKSNSKLKPLIEGSEFLPPTMDIHQIDFENDDKAHSIFNLKENVNEKEHKKRKREEEEESPSKKIKTEEIKTPVIISNY
eukprot:gene8279-104_t